MSNWLQSAPRRCASLLIACLTPALVGGCGDGGGPPRSVELEYPQTQRGAQVDDYHGTQVADPYRWLEELDGDETRAWVKAQNDVAKPFLARLDGRVAITQRLEELWNHERIGSPTHEAGLAFLSRNDGLQDHSVLYVTDEERAGRSATEALEGARVLLDPNQFSEDKTVALAGTSISPSARYIAYAKSDGGSDWRDWFVRDVQSGEDLSDHITGTKFTGVAWQPDDSGFFYSRYPDDASGAPDGSKATSVYFHALGTDQSEDQLIHSIPEHPRRNPGATVTDDGQYLLISHREGYLQNAVYVRPLAEPDTPLTPLFDQWDALYNFIVNDGTTFFFQTNLDAPKNRVIAIDITRPGDIREIIPQSDDTLQGTVGLGGRLVASYTRDAYSVVQVFATDGTLVGEIELPGVGSVGGLSGDWDRSDVYYSFSSYTTPRSVLRYDLETGETSTYFAPELGIDTTAFETTQVFYESKDGTRVPMFVTHRRDLEKTGDHPTLLYGYGGFNITQRPGFSTARAVWIEMGGILAVANLRGGGEYGREWHLAGTKLQKQNVFDDFIAAAEYLIDAGYTKSDKLAIQGGSNGGLLVGASMTQRPELFGAALPAVGVLDMLRYHLPSANARNWSTDYGLSENPDEFRAQYAYSPVHNVKDGACYPPTLVTTADHDDRVVPWHSYKFAAQLQASQGCANPVVISVETRAGHGAGKPTWMQIEAIADQWAFLQWALQM